MGVHHSWWAGRKARRAGECSRAQRRRPRGGIHACNPWSSAGQPGRGGRQPDMAAGGASRELRSNRARGGQKWSAASKLALRALTSKLTPCPMHPLGSPTPRFRPKCAKAAAAEQANMHARLAAGAPCNTFRGGLSLPEEVIFSGPGNACIMLAHVRNFHSRYSSSMLTPTPTPSLESEMILSEDLELLGGSRPQEFGKSFLPKNSGLGHEIPGNEHGETY